MTRRLNLNHFPTRLGGAFHKGEARSDLRSAFKLSAALAFCLGIVGPARAQTDRPSSPRDNWETLATEPYPGKRDDVSFADPLHGWYGTGKGDLYATQDGGTRWSKVASHPGTFIRSLAFVDAHTGFIGNVGTGYYPGVTDATPLYRTDDGGQTWAAVDLGGAAIAGICAIDVLRTQRIFQGRLVPTTVISTAGRVGGPAALPGGLLMIDRDRFRRLAWTEGRTTLLRGLITCGLLEGDPEEMAGRLGAARATEARSRARAGAELADRLLLAVGGAAPLLEILPDPVREAAGSDLEEFAVAALALAVHGPTVLTKLEGALRAEGLDPPGRWGGEAARLFVVDLGFPVEFATSASVRREAEVLVTGPVRLPPLHDYQDDILASLTTLIASGEGRRRAVVSLPTGGGKTRVAAETVVRLVLNGGGRRSALWIAQTEELCEQAVQCFRQLWSNVGIEGEDLRVVRLWGGQPNPTAPESGEAIVVVASIQTLNARFERETLDWLSRPGVVVIDECHHAIAPSYSSLLRWLDVQTGTKAEREAEPPVLCLSATPWRGRNDDESTRLAARFARRWLPHDQAGLHAELRRLGVLAELRYTPIHYDKPVRLTEEEKRHFEQYGELPESVIEDIGSDPDRNERILQKVATSAASSILLFTNSVRHARYLAARLHLACCPAAARRTGSRASTSSADSARASSGCCATTACSPPASTRRGRT